jgi:hypothetical protein
MYWIETFIYDPKDDGPKEITQLSATTPGVAWAIDNSNQIWKYQFDADQRPNSWTRPKQLPNNEEPLNLDSAWDGTVICISKTHKVYRYNKFNNSWQWIKEGTLNKISIANNGEIYVLGTNDFVYIYKNENVFSLMSEGAFHQISVGMDGTLLCIGKDDCLYRIMPGNAKSNFRKISDIKFNNIAVDSAAKIVGLTKDGKILQYIGEGEFHTDSNIYYYYNNQEGFEKWEKRTILGDYRSLSHDSDGNCYLITQDKDSAYHVYRSIEGEPPVDQE